MFNLPNSAGHAPLRQPRSIRRTTSIDVTWPDGVQGMMCFEGCGRDIFTHASGHSPSVLSLDTYQAQLDRQRVIRALKLHSSQYGENLASAEQALIGAKGGGYLRQDLEANLSAAQLDAPLGLLLDDLSGASLVAVWAWSRWPDSEGYKILNQSMDDMREKMEGVCIGFRPGSSALAAGVSSTKSAVPVELLPNPQDHDGWHSMPEHNTVSMRRARRLDVWFDEQSKQVVVDSGFQDSATTPTGGRMAVHEYSLLMRMDMSTGTINTIAATPRILPFPECPSAVLGLQKLVGKPVAELRKLVLAEYPKVKGCTHLNDALRALANVPSLVEQLKRLL